jgi:alkylation response protein AidB-like acyl-CoA dehydrogenase
MRWGLSQEQEMFRDAFGEWLADVAPAQALRRWLAAGDVTPFEERLVSDGWLGAGSPEELGGQGGGLLDLAVAAEQLGYGAAPGGSWLAAVLAVPALAARPDLAAAVLGQGEFAALAVTAGQPPDDPGPVRYAGRVLHGTVRSVLGAGRARHLIVPVWREGGCELFAVDAADGAVSRRGRKLLDRSRCAADVSLSGAPGQALDVDGGQVLADAALRAAVLVAADSLGAAARMLELAVGYSKQRTQFGVPIGAFQAVKHAAATMLVAVESSRSIAYFAAASVDDGGGDRALHAAAAKAQVTAAAQQVADAALTIHGAIGYTWEHDLQLFYKRAKLNAPLFGPPEVWNERLAAGLPLLPGIRR